MNTQTLGAAIAALRKEHGMTQLELAEKMGVTDKAVSKWERDLSCPDVNTLPRLAELFGVSVDELMQAHTRPSAPPAAREPLPDLILRAVALAMGVAVAVLSLLKQLDAQGGLGMLGLGLACLSLTLFRKQGAD